MNSLLKNRSLHESTDSLAWKLVDSRKTRRVHGEIRDRVPCDAGFMDMFIGNITALRLFDLIGREPAFATLLPEGTRLASGRPSPDDAERFAALVGGWGACPDPTRPTDVIVPRISMRSRAPGLRTRVWSGDIPAGSLVSAGHDIHLSTPAFSLLQLAASRPSECSARFSREVFRGPRSLGLSGEEMRDMRRRLRATSRRLALLEIVWLANGICGTYGLFQKEPIAGVVTETGGEGFRKRAPLSSVLELRNYARRAQGLPGAALLSQALAFVGDGSASPMETAMAMSYFMPSAYGGYGISSPRGAVPVRNYRVPKPAYRRSDPKGLPLRDCYVIDLAFVDEKLAIEYNGAAAHAGTLKRCEDESRRNDLVSMGWTVLFVSYGMMRRISTADSLAKTIAGCMGVSVRIRRGDFKALQAEMRSVVLPSLADACRLEPDR